MKNVALWHKAVKTRDALVLNDLLADDVIFYSPVVHGPQHGKKISSLYLTAAFEVLAGDTFDYVGDYHSETGTILEFETVIEGVHINGVDIITWNTAGKIIEFKVMLRPLKAVHKVHEMMAAMLEKMTGSPPVKGKDRA